MSGNLERRYRRVLRLLPGWYRRQWEQDMVAAFLDSWLTGDADADEYISKAAGPGWAETASVAGLAVRESAKGNVSHYPWHAHAHSWPPRHPGSWVAAIFMLAVLTCITAYILPQEVNAWAYAVGAEHQDTFNPASYTTACATVGRRGLGQCPLRQVWAEQPVHNIPVIITQTAVGAVHTMGLGSADDRAGECGLAGSGDKKAQSQLCRVEIDEVAVAFGPPT
jgi:hypothetical protein